MHDFFSAKSVAVIGASRNPKKLGHIVLENMLFGYKGKIYPINPEAGFILGQKCYRSVMDVEDHVDMAVIITPAQTVPNIVAQCSKKGVKTCVILSAGFGEIGNRKSEEIILKNARKMRILGPNCLGIYDSETGMDTLFTKRYRQERPKKGSISFVSQSGAFGAAMLDIAASEHIGLSKFISIGNSIDIDEVDLLQFLEKDDKTRTIALYLEGARRGHEFIKTLGKLRKPAVILKAGKTNEGAKAIESHTSILAGESAVYSSIFRQTKTLEARNIDELFDFSKALDLQPLPKGKRVQIITNGGGFGIIAVDALVEEGLDIAKMSGALKAKVRKQVPKYIVVSNPLDLTGDADSKRYEIAVNSALKDRNVDAILLIVLFQLSTLNSAIIKVISDAKKYKKPIVLCSLGGEFTELYKRLLEENGIPTYPTPNRAARALSILVQRAEFLGKIKKLR